MIVNNKKNSKIHLLALIKIVYHNIQDQNGSQTAYRLIVMGQRKISNGNITTVNRNYYSIILNLNRYTV